jgi:hypothetical protein
MPHYFWQQRTSVWREVTSPAPGLLATNKLNMSWHRPDLYFFLCLLAGFATFLAIVYECIQKFGRKPPVVLKKAKPLDGLQRDRPRPTEERHVMEEIDESSRQAGKQAAERFSRLCESIKDLSPKEQVSPGRESARRSESSTISIAVACSAEVFARHVRFRANRTLSRHRQMTESDPKRTCAAAAYQEWPG